MESLRTKCAKLKLLGQPVTYMQRLLDADYEPDAMSWIAGAEVMNWRLINMGLEDECTATRAATQEV